jgi:hypothetical protein
MSDLYVVTLWPYHDGSEARYQFDDPLAAQRFAERVNKLSHEIRRDIVDPEGNPNLQATVWKSSTYDSTDEAITELMTWIVCDHPDAERDDDGRDHQFFRCTACGEVVIPVDEGGETRWEDADVPV